MAARSPDTTASASSGWRTTAELLADNLHFDKLLLAARAEIASLKSKLRRVKRVYWTVRWTCPEVGPPGGPTCFYPDPYFPGTWGPNAPKRMTRTQAFALLESTSRGVRGTHVVVRRTVYRLAKAER